MKLLWGSYETEADVYGLLMFDWDWSEDLALRVEDIGTLICFACGMLILLAPLAIVVVRSANNKSDRGAISDYGRIAIAIQIICLLWIATWQVAISVLHAYRGGAFMAEWAVAAHAVRIFSPLALIALLLAKGDPHTATARAEFGDWVLRLATAATFITHGVEAIRLNPEFVDLLIGSAHNLLGWSLAESTTTIMLSIIGTIDIVLAIALICRRWRLVAGYLAFWGFVTACSRITAAGLIGFASAYPDTLIRAANGGAPLAVCILCYVAATTSPNKDQHNDA